MSRKKKNDNFVVEFEDDDVEFGLDDLEDMIDDGALPQMAGVMSAFVDSATKLTDVCANAEIKSGNKLSAKDVRKIFMENFSMITSIGMADDE